MLLRRFALILPLLLLPVLAACGGGAPPSPPPLSAEALAAVTKNTGTGRERLARAVETLFANPESTGKTRAIIIMHDGRRVAERYAPGFHENTRFLSWSMAKTVTGVMIGQLVSDGRLKLDESAPIPAWQRPGDPRGEITVRHLLQMRSGLRHSEGRDPVYASDEVRMLFLEGRDNMAAYAEAQPLESVPGRKFEYSTATSVILSDLAARVLAEDGNADNRRRAVSEYMRTRLFEPMGMKSALPEFDAAGTQIGGSMIHATARDWALFGEFLRNKGAVRGAQLVPVSWIEFMTRPSPRNSAYGAQIWLNRHGQEDATKLFPDVPSNVFACQGHLGQVILVSPTQKLTIVRLGHTLDGQRPELNARISRLAALFRGN